MAISFYLDPTDPDLSLDEAAGVDTGTGDDDIDAVSFDLEDEALEAYLKALPTASYAFPQYAMQSNYLQSGSTIDDYALVYDDTPLTAYSTTVGQDSGIKDLDGNTIFLFAYSTTNNNVVLGRVGSGTDDDPNGDVAFAFVLDEHKIDGHVDSVDAWMIQYMPLAHDDPTKVDADDPLDLADKVFVEATTTSILSVFTTSGTVERHAYDMVGQEGAQPEIVDSQLAPASAGFEFWVQFTGDHATGGKNAVALKVGPADDVAPDPINGDTTFNPNDLFFAAPTSIQATNATNGVAGDTLQNGEVFDMLFYNGDPADPTNVIDQPPTQFASGIFLRFDGIGTREDLVVVLKLADKNDLGTIVTTTAIVVGSEDILKVGNVGSLAPDYLADYLAAKPLDNNDGLVVIEANDYNFDAGNDDYVIVGAQLLSSTEKVTGSGINLKTESGDTGGSGANGTVAFGKNTTQDTDVIKISDIGFIREGESETTKEYLGIGANLIIQDDGPSIDEGDGTATLTISEILHIGLPQEADFSALFGTPEYGVDGPAITDSLTYDVGTYDIPPDSGMVDTATGNHIFLFLEDNDLTPAIDFDHKVVGRVGTGGDGNPQSDDAGEISFFLYVDADGHLILQQNRAVKHAIINGIPGDDSVTFDSPDFVTLTATATDKDGDTHSATIPIGAYLTITDAAPAVDQSSEENLTVSNDKDASPSVGDVDGAAGNDGAATYAWTISGAPSGSGLTVAYTDSTHQTILGKLDGTDLYTLTVTNSGGYTFDLLSAVPGSDLPINGSQIHAQGPVLNYDIALEGTSGDYVRISGTNSDGTPGLFNASNGYGGIGNGNLDTAETVAISLFDDHDTPATGDDTKVDITGIDIPTKTGNFTTHYIYTAYNDGNSVGSDTEDVGKGGTFHIDFGGTKFDTVVITDTNGNAVKLGIGDAVIHVDPPDMKLGFDLRLTDGDGDYDTINFFVGIDGNGGGIDPATALLAAQPII